MTLVATIVNASPPAPGADGFTNGSIVSGVFAYAQSQQTMTGQTWTLDGTGSATYSGAVSNSFTGVSYGGVYGGFVFTSIANPTVNYGPVIENSPAATVTFTALNAKLFNSTGNVSVPDPTDYIFNTGEECSASGFTTPQSFEFNNFLPIVGGMPFASDALGLTTLVQNCYTNAQNSQPVTDPFFPTKPTMTVSNNIKVGSKTSPQTTGLLYGGVVVVFYGDKLHIASVGVTGGSNVYPDFEPLTVEIDGAGNVSAVANGTGDGSTVTIAATSMLADSTGLGISKSATNVLQYNPSSNNIIADTGNSLTTIGIANILQAATGIGDTFYAADIDGATFKGTLYESVGSMSSFVAQAVSSGGNPTLSFIDTGDFFIQRLWWESGSLHAYITQVLPGPSLGPSYIVAFSSGSSAAPYTNYPLPPILPAACIPSCGS